MDAVWLLVFCLFGFAETARAQIAANVILESNALFRGETISRDDPAVTIDVSYDHPSGFFAGASFSVAAGDHDPRMIANTQYGGFALRRGEVSLEVGAIRRDYDTHSLYDEDYHGRYVEGFVGASYRKIRARIYVSPSYLADRRNTFYGDVNALILQQGKWSLSGHAGLYAIPRQEGVEGPTRFYIDGSLTVARPIGSFNASLTVANSNYPVFSLSKGTRLFDNKPRVALSLSKAF